MTPDHGKKFAEGEWWPGSPGLESFHSGTSKACLPYADSAKHDLGWQCHGGGDCHDVSAWPRGSKFLRGIVNTRYRDQSEAQLSNPITVLSVPVEAQFRRFSRNP